MNLQGYLRVIYPLFQPIAIALLVLMESFTQNVFIQVSLMLLEKQFPPLALGLAEPTII